jgi:hypothetical protein
MKQTITQTPSSNGRYLTLDEIDSFVKRARSAGALHSISPKVRITWSGHIKEMELTVNDMDLLDYSE